MTGIIIAHGLGLAIAERHREILCSWFDHVEWICPEDDLIPWATQVLGLSTSYGLGAIQRQRLACQLAAQHETAAVVEYDTLLFGRPPEPKEGMILSSRVHHDPDPVWANDWFSLSPWVCMKKDWAKLAVAEVGLELGFSDRWMAAAAKQMGIGQEELPNCFSRGTIDNETDIRGAIDAILAGGTAFHGVKHESVFNRMVEARREYERGLE